MELKIVKRRNGNYALEGFSIKDLKKLVNYHQKQNIPRKWNVSEDFSRLILE